MQTLRAIHYLRLCAQAVKDTKELREAVETVQPERVKLALRLGQSRALYQGFQVSGCCFGMCWMACPWST